MKYYLQLGFVLLLITAIASGVLAYINGLTAPMIQENQRRIKAEARQEVLSEATVFDSIGAFNNEAVYAGKDADNVVVGFTFLASLYGYSSNIKTMVGVKPDLIVNKIKIISQTETPGLGANCQQMEFQAQFSDQSSGDLVVDKDGGQIVSITGATITTRTIANSIRNGLEYLTALKITENAETAQAEEEAVE